MTRVQSPRNHRGGGYNYLPQVVLWPPCVYAGACKHVYMRAHVRAYTHTRVFLKELYINSADPTGITEL